MRMICQLEWRWTLSAIPITRGKIFTSMCVGIDVAHLNRDDEPAAKRPKITEIPKPSREMSYEHATELMELVESFGTKMGNMMFYLKRLWDRKPEARVILFSQVQSY